METIEQAIKGRLEEKRIAREKAELENLERQAELEGRLNLVGKLFREWVAKQYSLDLGDCQISVTYSKTVSYQVRLCLGKGWIDLQNPVSLYGDAIDVVKFTSGIVWHAVIQQKGDNLYVDYENLIDALTYTLYGTSTPEVETVEYPEMVAEVMRGFPKVEKPDPTDDLPF